jgi:hypothetical protein
MLETARFLWRAIPDLESYAEKRVAARAAIQLADVVAVTTPVAGATRESERAQPPRASLIERTVGAGVGLPSLCICVNGI